MKYLLLLFVFISCSSCGKTIKDSVMVIESKEIRGGRSKVFYQVRGDSISKYSYVISNLYGVSLEINDNLANSSYFVDISDEVAGKKKAFNDGKYFVPTFSEQMSEMKECLKKASEEFDISKLYCIACFSTVFDSVACDISSRILSNNKGALLSYAIIDSKLAKTSLKDSLNRVLESFNLQVDTIKSQEEISRCDKTALYYRSPVFKKKEMPPFIIETHLCIMLRQKE